MPPEARRELLIEAGEALYGDQWQRALARALGPLHPQGPRERIDDRLVRRWAAQEQGRDVPEWVLGALRSTAESRASELQDLLQRLPPKDVP